LFTVLYVDLQDCTCIYTVHLSFVSSVSVRTVTLTGRTFKYLILKCALITVINYTLFNIQYVLFHAIGYY